MKEIYIKDIGEMKLESRNLYVIYKKIIFFDILHNARICFEKVEDNDKYVSEIQKKIYLDFFKNFEKIRNTIEKELYNYYINEVLKYQNWVDDEFIDNLPILDKINDMRNLVNNPTVYIDDQDEDDGYTFTITFECKWCSEQNIGIIFEGDEFIEIDITEHIL